MTGWRRAIHCQQGRNDESGHSRRGRRRSRAPWRSQDARLEIDAHTVVPDAGSAAAWYVRAFGAEEQSRIPLPGGKVLSVVLRFGRSHVHVASEFPDFGVVSPLTVGGTATVLQINTDDADALWSRALQAGAEIRHELTDQFWANATDNSRIPSAIAGTSRNISKTSPPTRSPPPLPACSAQADAATPSSPHAGNEKYDLRGGSARTP
jgi:PhnB protein